jgi:hypothetical protein
VPRGARRIGGAEVAHDADAVREALAEDGPEHVVEERFVATVRIRAARELRQRERALGERFEHEHRGLPEPGERIDHGTRRVGAVAGETGGATDEKRCRRPLFEPSGRSRTPAVAVSIRAITSGVSFAATSIAFRFSSTCETREAP